ncbi:DUF7365 family protein [Staphylococcus xylosus]|uniref:DUF7365 family protein n=1 Tax=Staphylococcus xylosus TaxID=1288 RepID=UPI000D1D520E|nr:hypothetical protein [Staphylococcus xylosus]PTI64217.1 hypothetical protein BU095_06375 [Staphylococcus xylosus]
MDQFGLAHWLLFTVIPLGITLASFWKKVSEDKTRTEKRFSDVENKVIEHEKTLGEIKENIRKQSEDLKLLHKLNTQSDMMLKMMDEIKQDLKK